MTEQSEQPHPLPQSQILSYVTNISTPTRVRRVARLGLRWCAALCTLALLILGSGTIYEALLDYLAGRLRVNEYGIPFVMGSIFTGCALFQWFLAPTVEAGNARVAGQLQVTLLPPALILIFLAILIGGLGSHAFIAIPENDPLWQKILLAITGLLGILIALASAVGALLVVDLSKLLTWIAKQPAAEKPPTPFLY